MTTATWRERVAQQVGEVVERVADELLEVLVVERVELHELAFVGRHREAFAGEVLGVADDLFELALGLGVAPAGHAHRHERDAAHQRRRHDHAERDVLERPHDADRAEALADDEHDQAERHRHQRRHPDAPELTSRRFGRLGRAHRQALAGSYFSVRAITRRWISFVPS